jgi:hypothetical protein
MSPDLVGDRQVVGVTLTPSSSLLSFFVTGGVATALSTFGGVSYLHRMRRSFLACVGVSLSPCFIHVSTLCSLGYLSARPVFVTRF